MGTIRAMLTKFQTLDLESEIPKIIERTSDAIIQKNTGEDQLLGGLDSRGDKINPEYHLESYADEKEQMNSLPGRYIPDLKLTGAFYGGFEVTIEKDTFKINSTDDKALNLELKYGRYIFGLSKKNKTDYALNEFYTELKKYITEKTGLRFK
jgi:hypothetical protein